MLTTSLFSLFFLVGCDDNPAPTDVVPHEHAAAVLEVTPAEATLDVGETLGLETSVRCDCGEQLHPALTWSSADPAIATIDESGTVEAVATGTTTLTAAVNGLEEATVVEVTDGVVSTLDEEGGEITSPDGGVTLVVPAGALEGPTEIRLEPVPDAEFAGDDAYVPGTAYRCSPDGLEFRQGVRVRDRYDPEHIPGDADQDRLRLHLRERLHDGSGDGDQYRWRQTERGRVMAQDRTVEGDVGACGTVAIRVQSQNGNGPGGPNGPNDGGNGSAQSDRSGNDTAGPSAEDGDSAGQRGGSGTPGDDNGRRGTPGDDDGTPGDDSGRRGTPGDDGGTPGDDDGTPGDDDGTPGDDDGTPGDDDGTPGDDDDPVDDEGEPDDEEDEPGDGGDTPDDGDGPPDDGGGPPDDGGSDSGRRGGGGSGGGSGGGGSGGGGPDQGKGDLYADLVYLYRSADGLPILRDVAGESCLQPVSYSAVPNVDPVQNPLNGETVWLLPLVGDQMAAAAVEPTDEDELEPCDVQAEYATYMREVEIGRLNVGRSPDRVLDRALDEVLLKLGAASEVLLDHAGRLAPDDVPIDAPGENLAIHQELQVHGQIAGHSLPYPPQGYSGYLDHAASGLGAAADKFGRVDADLVVYNNRILNMPDEVSGGMSTLTGNGTIGESGVKYLNYSGYSYNRASTFPGCVVYFRLEGDEMVRYAETLMEAVFNGQQYTGGNVAGYAQRADDARAVILFEHDTTIQHIDRIGETAVCTAENIQ